MIPYACWNKSSFLTHTLCAWILSKKIFLHRSFWGTGFSVCKVYFFPCLLLLKMYFNRFKNWCYDAGWKWGEWGVVMVHVITCYPLPRYGQDRCYMDTCIWWLQIRYNFGKTKCVSTYSGVKANRRHQLVRNFGSAWAFCKASQLSGDCGSKEVWVRLESHPSEISIKRKYIDYLS